MGSTVLILGARGRLGSALAKAFVQAGWRVLGQVRPQTRVDAAGVECLPIAVADTAALAQAAQGASVVINALNPPYTEWVAQARTLMDNAIQLAQTLGVPLMFPGNVYNFGQNMPPLLDENTPQHPTTVKGQLRVDMERQLNGSAVRSVIIRSGDFFGSGKGSWFDLVMVKDIAKGKVALPHAQDVATPWVYLPDLAQAYVAVAQKLVQEPLALPQHASFCYDGYQLTGRDWLQLLEPVARDNGWLAPGKQLKVGGMPWGVLRALSWAVPMFRELLEMRYLGHVPHALVGSRLTQAVGPLPKTPLPQAVRQAVADLALA